MPFGKCIERIGLAVETFERFERRAEPDHEIAGGGKLAVGQSGARIGPMQIDRFVPAEFLELRTDIRKRPFETGAAGARPWSTQDRAFERGDRGLPAKPK